MRMLLLAFMALSASVLLYLTHSERHSADEEGPKDLGVAARVSDDRLGVGRTPRSIHLTDRGSRQGSMLPTAASVSTGFYFDAPLEYTYRRGDGYADFESIAIGDVTGDGRNDLVAAATYNTIYVFSQNADGTLADPVSHVFGTDAYLNPGELVLADFNNDGIKDAVAPGVGTWPWGADGDPRFINVLVSDRERGLQQRHIVLPDWEWVREWQALDVNADGNLDVLAICRNINVAYCSRYAVAYGTGDGSFGNVEWMDMPTGYAPYRTWSADINQDAATDLLVSVRPSSAASSPEVWSLARRSSGGLDIPRTLYTTPASFPAFLVDDFNGDRQPDTLAFADTAFARIRLLALGGLTTTSTYGIDLGYLRGLSRVDAAVSGDIDGDRRSDLISAQIYWPLGETYGITQIGVYLQRNGVLQSPVYFDAPAPNGISTKSLAIGDLNSDGCKDLAIAATNYRLGILYGRNCASRGQITSRPSPAYQAQPSKTKTHAGGLQRIPHHSVTVY